MFLLKKLSLKTVLLDSILIFSFFLLTAYSLPPTANKLEKLPAYVPGEVLVKYKEGVPLAQKEKVKKAVGLKKSPLDKINIKGPSDIYLYQLKGGASVKQVISKLKAKAEVQVAEPNYIYRLAWTPNDAYFSKQWGLHNTGQQINGQYGKADADIDAPEAWDIEKGTTNPISVAVIDTGIDKNHSDLTSQLWVNQAEASGTVGIDDDNNDYIDDINGYNFVFNSPNILDDNGHGTHVSGIMAAAINNAGGVAGVAPGAKIMALKAADASGAFYLQTVLAAIYYAADKGAKVINMSFAGPYPSTELQNALNYAYNKGVVLVAAAGNNADKGNTIQYPAAYPNVISVGATNNKDEWAYFSTHNSYVDVSAPGVYIYSTIPGSSYGYMTGTSMAAPMVSGVTALIRSHFPALTPLQVEQILKQTADDLGTPGRDDYYGYGRVNAYKALKDLQAPKVYLSLPVFSTRDSTSPTFKVAWSASDPLPSSGIASYKVLYKIGSRGSWTTWLPGTTSTSAYFSGYPGKTYYFKVKARDKVGNVGVSKVRYIVVPYNQAAAKYSGSWYRVLNQNFFKGDSKFSGKRGSYLKKRFSGVKRLALIITRHSRGGYGNVYINGYKIKTINFYSASKRYRVVKTIASFSTPTTITLKVVVPHKKSAYSSGYQVQIDGLAIQR